MAAPSVAPPGLGRAAAVLYSLVFATIVAPLLTAIGFAVLMFPNMRDPGHDFAMTVGAVFLSGAIPVALPAGIAFLLLYALLRRLAGFGHWGACLMVAVPLVPVAFEMLGEGLVFGPRNPPPIIRQAMWVLTAAFILTGLLCPRRWLEASAGVTRRT